MSDTSDLSVYFVGGGVTNFTGVWNLQADKQYLRFCHRSGGELSTVTFRMDALAGWSVTQTQ